MALLHISFNSFPCFFDNESSYAYFPFFVISYLFCLFTLYGYHIPGLCYLEFVWPRHRFAVAMRLGFYPLFSSFISLALTHEFRFYSYDFDSMRGKLHGGWRFNVLGTEYRFGPVTIGSEARILAHLDKAKRKAEFQYNNATIPKSSFSQFTRNLERVSTDVLRYVPTAPIVHSQRTIVTHAPDVRIVRGGELQLQPKGPRGMNPVSAMASGQILFGRVGLQGTYSENLKAVLETFGDRAINTSLPTDSKQYQRLVSTLRIPLNYVPNVKGHDAAGTCRRAWISRMVECTDSGRVGMVSPSLQEWHLNPYGVAHYYNEDYGVDRSRIRKPCAICGERRCKVLDAAETDGRVSRGSMSNASLLFRTFGVDFLWLVNIEPNISSKEVLALMVDAKIEVGYSALHVDWNSLHQERSYCVFTEQETSVSMGKVISKFSDSGTYVQDMGKVRQLFGPTFGKGCALRRTIIGRAGTSMLVELNVDHAGLGMSFVPDRSLYYLIPVPHPSLGVAYLKVERKGLDRVLHTFRTVVNRNVEAARIQLRQANVTYSVSGTQLTSRLEVSATDYELLSIWMVAYSSLMDVVATIGSDTIEYKHGNTKTMGKPMAVATSVMDTIIGKLLGNTSETNPQFGSQNSVRQWLKKCEADGRFLTLEQISEKSYAEVFGKNFAFNTSWNFLNSCYGKIALKYMGVNDVLAWCQDATSSVWRKCFDYTAVVMTILLKIEVITDETLGFTLDSAVHACRILGMNHDGLLRTRNWLATRHKPAGKIWCEILEAQKLPFQVASVKIVESFVNDFNPDAALLASIEQARSNDLVTSMGDIPYSSFLAELKLYLGTFNTRAERYSQLHAVLSAADAVRKTVDHDVSKKIDSLMKDAKGVMAEVNTDIGSVILTNSRLSFCGDMPPMLPLPIKPVNYVEDDRVIGQTTVNQAFIDKKVVELDMEMLGVRQPKIRLSRLSHKDGKIDFSPIHDEMRIEYESFMEKTDQPFLLPPLPVGATCSYSPDEVGSIFLSNIAKRAVKQSKNGPLCQPFATQDQIVDWITSRSAMTEIMPVKQAIESCAERLNLPSIPYLMHIEGLAMGGKSQGVRHWISDQDCVVVPSRKLKKSWISDLGELEPFKRASVHTQHTALTRSCSRFVIVDEAYTYETPHLELLRKFPGAKGLITISDGHQVRDVFAEGTSTFNPAVTKPIFTAIAPVSFVPYDCLVTYLRETSSEIVPKMYYSGSLVCNGLFYTVQNDEFVIPGKADVCINGTQNGKGIMIARGVEDAVTAHESQGSRSECTFVHATASNGLCPDMAFLKSNPRHFGVVITRARKLTCFVVADKRSAKELPFIDNSQVNGSRHELPTDVLYGGTCFDLVDPVTIPSFQYERCENDNITLTHNEMYACDNQYTLGSFVNPEDSEAFPIESITHTILPADTAHLVNTYVPAHAATITESMIFNPANVMGVGEMNMIERQTQPTTVTPGHYATASKIVDLLFDSVIDPKMFMKIASECRGSIPQQTRDQVMKMALAKQGSKVDSTSFAFGKNEPSKKVITLGGGMKALSVTAMNATQLALFSDVSDTLTIAWNRSLYPGILTPVGFTKAEIARKLGSMGSTFEIDIDRQDSSHTAIHVAVFLHLMAICAKRLGLDDLAREIRQQRVIGDMQGRMRIVMGTGLGSGDIWTLIANQIMAMSTLVSRYVIPRGISVLQVGDDFTSDGILPERKIPIAGSDDVKLKFLTTGELWSKYETGVRPSFTSNTSINEEVSIAARVRGIVKMAYAPRNRTQHIAYGVECQQMQSTMAVIGMPEYCQAFHSLFGADPSFVEQIIVRATRLSRMHFDDVPVDLRLHAQDEKKCVVHSSDGGCFGFALAHAVTTNVQALNAFGTYTSWVSKSECADICAANKVEYSLEQGRFIRKNKKSTELIVEKYLARGKSTPVVYIFDDHALSITSVSSETVTFSGIKRYKINLMTETVEDMDF